jgi:hypothetical protein
MKYTSDKLIETVKRNAGVPTSQRKFSDQDLLAFLNEELELTIVTELINQQQDYFIERSVIPLIANTSEYELPSRSVGWKVESIGYLNASGDYRKLSKISRSMRGDYTYYQTADGPAAFYIEGTKIVLIPDVSASVSGSLEVDFVRIHNELVNVSSAGLISTVTDLGASYQMTVDTIPSTSDGVDVVSGSNPFSLIEIGGSAVVAGFNITVAKTLFSTAPVAGDYVTASGETPIPNIPEDFHPVLAQAATLRALISLNDVKGIQTAQISLQRMLSAMAQRSKTRVSSAPTKLVSRSYFLNSMRQRIY